MLLDKGQHFAKTALNNNGTEGTPLHHRPATGAQKVQLPSLLDLLRLPGQPDVRLAIGHGHGVPRVGGQLGNGGRGAHAVDALVMVVNQYLVQAELVHEVEERRRRRH